MASWQAGFGTRVPPPSVQDQTSRLGTKASAGIKRTPLGDITNGNILQGRMAPPSYRQPDESYPPVEHMYLPPPPPKYKGFEFCPSTEPWFETQVELEPMVVLDKVDWKF
jgi:hypothetical protein